MSPNTTPRAPSVRASRTASCGWPCSSSRAVSCAVGVRASFGAAPVSALIASRLVPHLDRDLTGTMVDHGGHTSRLTDLRRHVDHRVRYVDHYRGGSEPWSGGP